MVKPRKSITRRATAPYCTNVVTRSNRVSGFRDPTWCRVTDLSPQDQNTSVAYARPPLFSFLSAGTMPAEARQDAMTRPERSDHGLFSRASRPTPRKPMHYQPTKSAGSLPTAGPPQSIGNDDAVGSPSASGTPAKGNVIAQVVHEQLGTREDGPAASVGVVAVGHDRAVAVGQRTSGPPATCRALLSIDIIRKKDFRWFFPQFSGKNPYS